MVKRKTMWIMEGDFNDIKDNGEKREAGEDKRIVFQILGIL